MPEGFMTRPEEISEGQPTAQNNTQIDPKALTPPQKTTSRFNAPIPGESLTSTPKNMNFEKPPQFVDLEETTEFLWDRLNERDSMLKLLAMLDKQIPVDGIAKTILFSGFASGKWTPDLAILLAKPVTAMIMAIGNSAGINMRMHTKK